MNSPCMYKYVFNTKRADFTMLLEQVHIIATNVAIGVPGGNRIHRTNSKAQHSAFSRP